MVPRHLAGLGGEQPALGGQGPGLALMMKRTIRQGGREGSKEPVLETGPCLS